MTLPNVDMNLLDQPTCILTYIVISSHYMQIVEFGSLLKLKVWSKDKTCYLP